MLTASSFDFKIEKIFFLFSFLLFLFVVVVFLFLLSSTPNLALC